MTADWQTAPQRRSPMWLSRAVHRIERSPSLDAPVRAMASLADRVLRSPQVYAALRGEQLGHALHPLLTDFPLGSWTSASLVDLFGGQRARSAATGLVGFGVAMTLPTALAGLAEWRSAGHVSRRVGVVHAAVNTTTLALYTASLLARLRGNHSRGVVLALAGGGAGWAGGYLGGHLSLVRKIGTADPSFGPVDGLR
ncbi:MAG TPA: DUF2231 domain-containing protein [Acidimicrobiales bacterium]|nr:DUF2231 domain-containing protein [Acidimicrobiales bacterium]